MILILLNWTFIIYISFMTGFAVRKNWLTDRERSDISITILCGFFIVSLAATASLFFVNAGPMLLAAFFVVASGIHVFYRRELRDALIHFKTTALGSKESIFGALLLFCLLVFSSQSSKINDDGLYYTQTVMWFTDTGFVQGISNLLLPLGLGSSWHILQAVYSFDFIEGVRFNDLNGLLVFVFFIFCAENGAFNKGKSLLSLLLAATLVVSVPFLSACAPDLPVIILTIIGFYLVVTRLDEQTIADVLFIAAFAMSTKFSAIALVMLAIFLILYSKVKHIPFSNGVYLLLILCSVSVLLKNIYQTGYPLYPYPWLGFADLEWTTPREILHFYTAGIKSWGVLETFKIPPVNEWENPGIVDTVQMMLKWSGLKGLINIVILLTFPLILITLIWDVYRRWKITLSSLQGLSLLIIFIVSFLAWLVLAPQYRFILPAYIFYFCWCLWIWVTAWFRGSLEPVLKFLQWFSLGVLLLASAVPVSLDLSSTSKQIGEIDSFKTDRIVKPHFSYSFHEVDTLRIGEQEYYHVTNNAYCWDGPLPCLSRNYYHYLKRMNYCFGTKYKGRIIFTLEAQGSQ